MPQPPQHPSPLSGPDFMGGGISCRDEETEAHDVVAFGDISCLVVK